MSANEDLQDRLWELIYGLLPDEEAAALCDRITSDPDVARAYSKAVLQSELVGAAARYDDPPEKISTLEPLRGVGTKDAAPTSTTRSNISRTINWIVTTAAVGLLCITGYAFFGPNAPLNNATVATRARMLNDAQVRTVVTTPAVLHQDLTNPVEVRTTSLAGVPVSTEVKMRVRDQFGRVKLDESKRTDAQGVARFAVSGNLLGDENELEVFAANRESEAVTTHHRLAPTKNVTYLTVDRPFYRPGDTVFYRSLTVARFDLQASSDLPIEYSIHDAAGNAVEDSTNRGLTNRGVGQGSFAIPADSPGGKFTLMVKSSNDTFPTEQRDFYVHDYKLPRLNKRLELAQDSYSPSDEVVADLSVERVEGGALAQGKLEINAFVDQQQIAVPEKEATTDENGQFQIRFRLPAAIRKGDAMLAVNVTDGAVSESIATPIPIQLGLVELDLFPEGGDLVADVPSRIYFFAHDPSGEPVHVQGRVVDSKGMNLATVETERDGRGKFSIVPQRDESYSVVIEQPPTGTTPVPIPKIPDESKLVLDTGRGVFQANAPVELTMRSNEPSPPPLVVAAFCRGGLVGLASIEPSDFENSACSVKLPVAEEASGVVRVTVYDYGATPPRPMVERLVFRRPTRKLDVSIDGLAEQYAPGESVTCTVVTRDEKGRPLPSVVGASVVDKALLALAGDEPPGLETYFYLTTELEDPSDLEDANFYLGEGEEAESALDLLLGTQGWRRFVEMRLDELAMLPPPQANWQFFESGDELDAEAAPMLRLVGMDSSAAVPIQRDNHSELRRGLARASKSFHLSREKLIRRLGQITLIGGLGIIVTLIILGVSRHLRGMRFWAMPALVATASLVLGLIWMSASVGPNGKIAYGPLASRRATTSRARAVTDSAEVAVKSIESATEGFDVDDLVTGGLESQEVADAFGSVTDAPVEPPEPGKRAFSFAPKIAVPEAESKVAKETNLAFTLPAQEGRANASPAPSVPASEDPAADVPAAGVPGAGVPAARVPAAGAPAPGAGAAGAKIDASPARQDKLRQSLSLDQLRSSQQPQPAAPQRFRRSLPSQSAEADDSRIRAALDAVMLHKQKGQVDNQFADLKEADKKVERRLERFQLREYFFSRAEPAGGRASGGSHETLLWQPMLITDAEGQHEVSFSLPNATTTFRLRADAHAGGRLGSGTATVQSVASDE